MNIGRKNAYTHKMVMLTFVGTPPAGAEVTHLNGDPNDNKLSNLAYRSHSDNIRDILAHGKRVVSVADVKRIRECPKKYGAAAKLARELGVSSELVYNIRARRVHDHID